MPIKRAKEIMQKTPDERKYIDVDFSGDMVPGETIDDILDTSIVADKPSGASLVTLAVVSYSGQDVQVLTDGGQSDADYVVSHRILTSLGQIFDGEWVLQVRD